MSEYILQLSDISKSFAGVHALRSVQLALRPGEVHALLGENGAGKSTLVLFISHRLEELFEIADQVTVLRDGAYVDTRPMTGVSQDELIRLMVGRTVNELFPKQTVTPGAVVLRVANLTRAGAFSDVSFELRQGEILGMAGLVGAGRTEVSQALFGVAPADSGTIEIDGQAVHIGDPRQALAYGLALVPEDRQQHGLVLPLDIADNITLPVLARFSRRGWLAVNEAHRAGYEAATRLEVKATSVWQKVRELSGGNQQKVVLAKWLATKPRILILDEPTRGIDIGTKAAVHRLMGELAAAGLAIVMISSELPEVLGMSDRILVMHEGRVTGRFSRAEATQEKIMLAATQSA